MYRFRNFGFFRGFPRFLRDPKNSQNEDFSAVSKILKDGLVQKFFAVFPAMNRARNLDFLVVSCNFGGIKKILETRFSPWILGISKYVLIQKFRNSNFPAVFLGF
jgi:hypothetical protein